MNYLSSTLVGGRIDTKVEAGLEARVGSGISLFETAELVLIKSCKTEPRRWLHQYGRITQSKRKAKKMRKSKILLSSKQAG